MVVLPVVAYVDPVHVDTASLGGGSTGCKGFDCDIHGDTGRSVRGRGGTFVLLPTDDTVDPVHADIASFRGGSIGCNGSGLFFGVVSFQDWGLLSRGLDVPVMDAPPSSTRLAP
jgi:hypothetical protein